MGVAETQATLKAQVPGVCRLYCSQVWNEAFKQARVEASSDLWKVENVYYPSTIRETAPSNSEARDVLEKAEAAGLEAVVATTAPDEPARESELFGATETNEGLNPEVPQKTGTLKCPRRLQSLQLMLRPFIPRSQLSLLSPFRLFPQMRAPRILMPFLLSSLRKGSR